MVLWDWVQSWGPTIQDGVSLKALDPLELLELVVDPRGGTSNIPKITYNLGDIAICPPPV